MYSFSFQLEQLKVIIIIPCSEISFPGRITVTCNTKRFPKTFRYTFGCFEKHFSEPEKTTRKAPRNVFGTFEKRTPRPGPEPGPAIQKLQDSDYNTVEISFLHTVIESRTEMSHTKPERLLEKSNRQVTQQRIIENMSFCILWLTCKKKFVGWPR